MPLLSRYFHLQYINVFVPTCALVLVLFLFCISYVTNLDLWLQDFNKLTYLLTYEINRANSSKNFVMMIVPWTSECYYYCYYTPTIIVNLLLLLLLFSLSCSFYKIVSQITIRPTFLISMDVGRIFTRGGQINFSAEFRGGTLVGVLGWSPSSCWRHVL